MHYILTAQQIRACDAFAINNLGIPPVVLMENAARSATERIREIVRKEHHLSHPHLSHPRLSRPEHFRTQRKPTITFFCASGNNGGDGFAIARHLCHEAHVRVLWIGSTSKMSPETLMNARSLGHHASHVGFPLVHLANEEDIERLDWRGIAESDVIVDALLGVGGSDAPRGLVALLLEQLAGVLDSPHQHHRPLTIAIDVPTGFHADTGKAHPHCFRADYTVTMAAHKVGMLLHGATDVCGTISVVDIGIPERVIADHASICALERGDIRTFLPARSPRTSKHDYGKVAVIGGAAGMLGAPTLAANACLAAGAGLVRVYSVGTHAALAPEVMHRSLPATDEGTIAEAAFDELCRAIEWADVVAFGPGLGMNEETVRLGKRFISKLITECPAKPVVIDADGLRCVERNRQLSTNIILTPHHGEFARLMGIPREQVSEKAHELAVEAAHSLGCVTLLKNVPTIISDGTQSFWNLTGNAGMATAGSGDVLTGIIAGLAAQGVESFRASALGAFLHGAAGDAAAQELSQESLTASAIIHALSGVLRSVRSAG